MEDEKYIEIPVLEILESWRPVFGIREILPSAQSEMLESENLFTA